MSRDGPVSGRAVAVSGRTGFVTRWPPSCNWAAWLRPSSEASHNEASSRVHSRSPVRSSPACGPRMERSPWAFPGASNLAVTSDARPGGDRHRALAWDYAVDVIIRPPFREPTRNERPRVAPKPCNYADPLFSILVEKPTTIRPPASPPPPCRRSSGVGIDSRPTGRTSRVAPSGRGGSVRTSPQ
jgi:hypothetical protein